MLSKKQREFFSNLDDQEFSENYRNVMMHRVRKKLYSLIKDLKLMLYAGNPYDSLYVNPLELNEIKDIYEFLKEFYSNDRYKY